MLQADGLIIDQVELSQEQSKENDWLSSNSTQALHNRQPSL